MITAFSKTMIDSCILPGTACGAEIVWLYAKQWQNRMSWMALALVSFAYSHMYIVLEQRLQGKIFTERENTK